jgi:hypothetical protein
MAIWICYSEHVQMVRIARDKISSNNRIANLADNVIVTRWKRTEKSNQPVIRTSELTMVRYLVQF